MTNQQIEEEFLALENKHKTWRVLSLIMGVAIIALGYYLIGDYEYGYRDNVSIGNLLGPFGGVIVGHTFLSWSGSRSHKLIKKLLINIRETDYNK